MRAIDATRAQRAREIYDAALSKPAEFETSADAAEWIDLEENGVEFNGRDCGVKHSNAPHRGSAYAHLPMRGITYGQGTFCGTTPVMKRRAIALWPELRVQKCAPIESQSKPHPQSAYSHLPLSGLGLEGSDPSHKWTLSASEKRELSARPLRHTLPAMDAAIARQAAA